LGKAQDGTSKHMTIIRI